MSIVSIDGEAVIHRCGACGFEREVVLELVELGVVPDPAGHIDLDGTDRANPLIVLPSCSKCGSVEVLHLPSADDPAEQEGDLARLWERLAGEPLDLSTDAGEPLAADITNDDYQSLF